MDTAGGNEQRYLHIPHSWRSVRILQLQEEAMTMDKLFDGSDAHLLPGNAELIADLRERINPAYADQRGTESYERKQCADALEAADKRIAELERKMAVAQEALEVATTYSMLEIDRKIIVEALAQIGGDDAS
jgi:hypothetical protein